MSELVAEILKLIPPEYGASAFVIALLIVFVIRTEKKLNRMESEICRLNEARVSEAMKLSECVAENTAALTSMQKVMELLINLQGIKRV